MTIQSMLGWRPLVVLSVLGVMVGGGVGAFVRRANPGACCVQQRLARDQLF